MELLNELHENIIDYYENPRYMKYDTLTKDSVLDLVDSV